MNRGNDVTPVFGLTNEQLWPIVEDVAGETVSSFEVVMDQTQPIPHAAGKEVMTPTFTYATEAGGAGRTTVFAKRCLYRPNGPSELQQYRFLTAHQAPIPRMYGVVVDCDERDVLFIEHVDKSQEALSHHSMERRREFFGLMARFHAITPSPEYQAWLEQAYWALPQELQKAESLLERTWKSARAGELGRSLQEFCSSRDSGLRQLKSLARHVVDRCLSMPQGLIHTDILSTENVGRLHSGELVVLDVEWVRMGPRYYDAGKWLGRPPERWPAGIAQTELARHFLNEYARWGGDPPSLSAFLDDVHILGLAENLRDLNWYWGHGFPMVAGDPERRNSMLDSMYRSLTMLLAQYRLRGTGCSALDGWQI
jgi:hypothetical protein